MTPHDKHDKEAAERNELDILQELAESNTPITDALIRRVMIEHPGTSKSAQAAYYEAVHQELAPLCRQLEIENTQLKAGIQMTWANHRAALSSPAEAGGKAQPFAYFQINPGWNTWEEVTPAAAGEDGVVAAYLAPPADRLMTFEEICLLICQHTGKRINIPVDQIEDMADFARAIESNHPSSTTTVSITPTASSREDL